MSKLREWCVRLLWRLYVWSKGKPLPAPRVSPRVRRAAMCRNSPLKDDAKAIARAAAAKAFAEQLPAHLEAFWAEQKLCELPEPTSALVATFVNRLKAGEEVELDEQTWTAWRAEYGPRLIHHYRIAGRLVDYRRATGIVALCEAGH